MSQFMRLRIFPIHYLFPINFGLVLFAFLLSLSGLRASTADDFLDRLRQAPSRIEDTDHKNVDPSILRLNTTWKGDRCSFSLTNISRQPVKVGNIILFDLPQHGLKSSTPVYGEGFQMLTDTKGILGAAYPSGYADADHYKIPQPDGIRTVYGMMTMDLGTDGHVLLGFSSCRRFIGRFSFNGELLRVSVDPEGLTIEPGETWKLEEFLAITGPDRNALLDRLAADIDKNHPPLPQPPLSNRSGWCTWYAVGGAGNQQIITDTVNGFASMLPEIRYIGIDEGYCLEGDWLEVNPRFGDMPKILDIIQNKGFLPAMWLAPFVAAPSSHTLAEHPEMFIQDTDGKPLDSSKIGFGGWSNGPWRVLDGTNPETQKYLENVFRTMREKWGITYFKLDANYWGALYGGKRFDPKATRVEAYRRGMEAIIRGAGPGAIILGCNAPIWPSFGLVNDMRTSNDISRSWGAVVSSSDTNLDRSWQNGRLWVSDPDCILLTNVQDGGPNPVTTPPDKISPAAQFLATVVHAVGGMIISGDKVQDLHPAQIAMMHKLIPPTGISARFESISHQVGITDLKNRQYYYALNWDNDPADRTLHLKQMSHLTDYWTGEDLGMHAGDYVIKSVPARSARLIMATP
jgi:alpha-galactosidase